MWFLLTDSRTGYRYSTWTLNIDAVISFINVACKINIREDDLITLNRSVHTGYWKLNYLPTVLCGMAQLECMNAWMDKQENKRVLMAFQAACDQLWQMVWNWSGSVELRGSCRSNCSFVFVWRRDEVHLQATFAAIISSPSFYVPQRIVLTLTKMQPSDKIKRQLCRAVGQWMFTQAWVKLLWSKPNQNSYMLYIWMTCLQGCLVCNSGSLLAWSILRSLPEVLIWSLYLCTGHWISVSVAKWQHTAEMSVWRNCVNVAVDRDKLKTNDAQRSWWHLHSSVAAVLKVV